MNRTLSRAPTLTLVALALCLLLPAVAHANLLAKILAPKPDLWSRWTAHDASSEHRIDHSAWDGFLDTYVAEGPDRLVRIAYGRVSPPDRAALRAYIASLAAEPISTYSRAEQFAFWVNLYNAQTVSTILEHYPVQSIRDIDISPGLFADGPWGKKSLVIEGESVSLDDIEHRILRPIWREPRVHYAVNCAAIGCPNLAPSAFTAENTERLLTQGAIAYVNHPRGVKIDDGALTLSSIYSWFEDDFAEEGGVLAHVRRYADPGLARTLESIDEPSAFEYDWRLNDAASLGG
ncbi:MAG: DUF547 domain-containing protein [Sedimenticolaceae bacterium]